MTWDDVILNKEKYIGGTLEAEESYGLKYKSEIVDIVSVPYDDCQVIQFGLDDGSVSSNTEYSKPYAIKNGFTFTLMYLGKYWVYENDTCPKLQTLSE
jgi:hypothetical protein